MASPLHQFEVTRVIPIEIGGVDLSLTNSAVYMFIAVGLVTLFFVTTIRPRALVPGRGQSVAELGYEFVANMIRSNVGQSGMKYFPFLFALFFFVLFGNMLGMMPFVGYTFTAQLIITFALALLIFVSVTVIGFAKHGTHFLHFFLPHGTPMALAPLLVPLEILSYCFRPISLALRLFANMTAGHTMMKVFAGFVASFLATASLASAAAVVPLAAVVALTALELLIAFLQAYVYTVLACIYLNDALHMH